MKKHPRSHSPLHCPPLGAAIALALTAASAEAATLIADGVTCSLIDALTAANTDAKAGGCPKGNGADTVELTADVTLTAINNEIDGFNGLPSVMSTITLNGQGHTIARSSAEGTPDFRLLHIADTGKLVLKQVTLQHGLPTFGNYLREISGGALFNRGTV